jgi:HlyD family secretion protein
MSVRSDQVYQSGIARHLGIGSLVLFLLVGALGGWAIATDISGAVLATGTLVVESDVKKIQHQTGGVVGAIPVRDGDAVKEGQLLVRLDETMARASLSIVTKSISELLARKARLEAERDSAEVITFPPQLLSKADDLPVAAIMASESKNFELRAAARSGQKSLLSERAAQIRDEISGHQSQEASKGQERQLIERELEGAKKLWAKNLMPITKLSALQREAARLDGERSQLLAAIAQGKGKAAEIEMQIHQVDREAGKEIGEELREAEAKIGELIERKSAAEDQMRRIDIRAPQAGTVHQSVVHTVGGVVAPGETLMLIVPESDSLAVEVKIAPNDIDQLMIGQTALLRFAAFSQRTTPEITGKVTKIAADITTDQRTGINYYLARVRLDPTEVMKLGSVRLVPGMPVEAMLKTSDRKVASYLLKPLQDQLARAFREN